MYNRQQITALRNADAVCFDLDSDGNGQIRAIVRGSDYEHEKTTVLPVEHSQVNDYSTDSGPYVGFAMITSAKYDQRWHTIASLITGRSRLVLRWTRDNKSPVTEEASIKVDHLDIVIDNGTRSYHIRVADYVGLDNSARMLRKA